MVTGKKTEDILQDFKNFRPEHSKLVIVIRKETASICVFQNSSSQLKGALHLPISETDSALDIFRDNGKDYDQVAIFYTQVETTLIPLALASEGLSQTCLEGLYHKEIGPTRSNQSNLMGLELIYSYPEEWHGIFLSIFPQADFHHISELVLLSSISCLHHNEDFVMVAHLEEESLFIMAFKGKELVFFNSFLVKGETDILYFMLHSMDSLGMDYQIADVQLSGYYSKMEIVIDLLLSYCPQSKVANKGTWKDEVTHILSKHGLCAS